VLPNVEFNFEKLIKQLKDIKLVVVPEHRVSKLLIHLAIGEKHVQTSLERRGKPTKITHMPHFWQPGLDLTNANLATMVPGLFDIGSSRPLH
jgi:hypothetical protein